MIITAGRWESNSAGQSRGRDPRHAQPALLSPDGSRQRAPAAAAFSGVGANAAGSVARGVVFLSCCSCCRALSRRIRT